MKMQNGLSYGCAIFVLYVGLALPNAVACGLKEGDVATVDKVLENSKENVVLIFCAKSGPYCKQYEQTVNEKACRLKRTTFLKIDIDDNPKLTEKFGVTGLPTTIIIKNFMEKKRVIGAASPEKIESIFRLQDLQ